MRCLGGTFLRLFGEIILREGYKLPTLFRNEVDSCCCRIPGGFQVGRGRRDECNRRLDGKESYKRKGCATRHRVKLVLGGVGVMY